MVRGVISIKRYGIPLVLGVAFVAPAYLDPELASACSCSNHTEEEAYRNSVNVFEARVLGFNQTDSTLRIEIIRSWKGALRGQAHLPIDQASSCAIPEDTIPRTGSIVLFYGQVVNLCTQFFVSDEAEYHQRIQVLQSREAPPGSTRDASSAGCASCQVGTRRPAAPGWGLLLLVFALGFRFRSRWASEQKRG